MKSLLKMLSLGASRRLGLGRTLHGLRTGDQRELYTGLGLLALGYLRKTSPQKKLLYRKTVPKGSSIVVHNRRRGDPKIEVVKPD